MNFKYLLLCVILIVVLILIFRTREKIRSWYIDFPEYLSESIKYCFINIIGNLFPIWFLLFIEVVNGHFDKIRNAIEQPYTYIILCATFLTTNIYMWVKQLKKQNNNKVPITLILEVIVLFPVIGYLSSQKKTLECVDNCIQCNGVEIIDVVVYALLLLIVIQYIFLQIKEFKVVSEASGSKERDNDYDALSDKFNKE
jgi:hypothetical protein